VIAVIIRCIRVYDSWMLFVSLLVVAFAGDALICVFLDLSVENDEPLTNYKASGSLRALQCACLLRTYHTSKLSAHLGVSYGQMKLALLGGLHDQWVYLMNGECVSELSRCIEDAGPKEVAATRLCYEKATEAMQRYAMALTSSPTLLSRPLGLSVLHNGPTSFAVEATILEEPLENDLPNLSEDFELQEALALAANAKAVTAAMNKANAGKNAQNNSPDKNSNVEIESTSSRARRREDDTMEMATSSFSFSVAPTVTPMQATIHTRACRDEQSPNILIDAVDDLTPDGGMNNRRHTVSGRRLSQVRIKASRQIEGSRHIVTGDNTRDERTTLIESAATFIPRPILQAVYSESLDHIGELRQVTTMFLSLDSYSPKAHSDPSSLQPFFLTAQSFLFDAGGFLRQFLVDDKGCVFIAMWGMPSFTYANNCSRALYCAVATLKTAQKNLNYRCSIGITTGNIFCGAEGSLERRDYAGIGNEVNLAARLMGKAKGRVLIDATTYSNLNQSTKGLLTPAEEMRLKGMENPVVPFQYTSDEIPKVAALDENPGHNTILRKQVKAILCTQMDRITNNNNSAINIAMTTLHHQQPLALMARCTSGYYETAKEVFFTIILGMPGTGKSTAAEYFRHGLRKRNIPCVVLQARPGHEGVPYGLMRELFLELIGDDQFETESQQRVKIAELIDQAYPEASNAEKESAMRSVEVVLGVDWINVPIGEGSSASVLDTTTDKNGVHVPKTTSGSDKSSIHGDRRAPIRIVKDPANSGHSPVNSNPTTPLPNAHEPPLGVSSVSMSVNNPNGTSTFSDISSAPATPGGSAAGPQIMLDDVDSTLHRSLGDVAFYKVLAVLFRVTRNNALVIEDAHFCDELSWNELQLILTGMELSLVVVITMRSNTNAKTQDGLSNSASMASSAHLSSIHGQSSARKSSVYARNNNIEPNNNNIDGNNDGDFVSKFGVKFQTSAAYLSILGHENTTVVEMSSLSDIEVKEILQQSLKVDDISNQLVKLVLEVSSGNAFWCKMIANFIKERGIKEFEKTAEGDSRQNSLKQLILLRMEKLSVDTQLIVRHAAIIGDEFSEKMLVAVLPEKHKAGATNALESLVEHGFITCIEEYPIAIFGFENQFIRQTVFELTPPRFVITNLLRCLRTKY
jgi:hypothetical protein